MHYSDKSYTSVLRDIRLGLLRRSESGLKYITGRIQ